LTLGPHRVLEASHREKRLLGAAATGLGLLASGGALAATSPSADVLLVAAIAVAVTLPVLRRVVSRDFDPFEPLVLFVIAYGVMFVVRPLAIILRDDYTWSRLSRTIDFRDTFTEMLALALVGACAFVITYESRFGPMIAARLSVTPREYDAGAVAAGAIAIAVLGSASLVAFAISQGGLDVLSLLLGGRSTALAAAVGDSSKYYWFGSYLFIPSALLLFALGRRTRSGTLVVFALALVAVVLLRAAPVGSRMMLLPLFVGFVVYWYLARLRRPAWPVIVLVGAAALVLSSVFLSIRDAPAREQESAVGLLLQAVDPTRITTPLTEGYDAGQAPLLAAALKVIPEEVGRGYGRATALDLVTRPIPRGAWEEKPRPPREQVIGAVWPGDPAALVANPEFSVLLFFYIDFGLMGVAIGMALYGVLFRLLFEYLKLRPRHVGVQLVFAGALPFCVVALRDSPTDSLMRAAFVVLPLWLILRVSARPAPLAHPLP
jgi:hypothetical protein